MAVVDRSDPTRTDRAAAIEAEMDGTIFGPVTWVDETGSTNADLLAAASSRARAGSVLLADHQTAGRGRRDRTWVTAPGDAVLVSVLVDFDAAEDAAAVATTLMATAAVEALAGFGFGAVAIKWPNDLVVGEPGQHRKLAGILAQAATADGRLRAVIGMGLNIRGARLDAPGAVALDQLGGPPPPSVAELVVATLTAFDRWWSRLGDRDGRAALRDRWLASSATVGTRVRADLGDGTVDRARDLGHRRWRIGRRTRRRRQPRDDPYRRRRLAPAGGLTPRARIGPLPSSPMPAARRPRPRRTWPQRLFLFFNLFVIVAALASAGVLAYAKDTVSSIPRVAFAGGVLAAEDPDSNEPINFLLVGADSASNLEEGDPLRNIGRETNQLTDTMIVLRVDPGSGDASVMSIPRDLWIPDLGYKINSAYALGEEDLLVSTIQDFLDIPIHRYIQVDFNGFLELMRVLGGIRVQIDYPLRDEKAQLRIDETGCVRLSPRQALGYVRSRGLEAETSPDNWVVVDGSGDLGRVAAATGLPRARPPAGLRPGHAQPQHPARPHRRRRRGWLRATRHPDHTPGRARPRTRLRGLPGREPRASTLPTEFGNVGQASVLFLVESEAQSVLNVFRGEAADNISFRVAVRNGTGETGLAHRCPAGAELRRLQRRRDR